MTGTAPHGVRFGGMAREIWLVSNDSSGSNDDAALAALEACFASHGLRVAHRTVFPAQDLPTPAILDAQRVELVAVFAGDGTVNRLVGTLAGWGGAVLVLPGGTMNLLYHRLHGDRQLEDVVAAVARGEAVAQRPSVIRCLHGEAYTEMIAGRGTSWARVREAMRGAADVDLADSARAAIDATLSGEMIACARPPLGRPEGYPLLRLEASGDSIAIVAYYAETPAEYLEHALSLLRRDFREGPHELLGRARQVRLANTCGNPVGLLIDGEQADAESEVEFTLAAAEVDLVATEPDGQ